MPKEIEVATRWEAMKINDSLFVLGRDGDLQCTTEEVGSIARKLNEFDAMESALSGLLGLLTLIQSRKDMPGEIFAAINDNHRTQTALALVARIEGR